MKKLFLLLLGAGLFVCTPDAQGQTAAKVGKYIQKVIKKTPKTKVNPSSSTRQTSRYSTTTRPRILFTDCSTCKGKGKVYIWNIQYQCYQAQDCANCYGTGRVRINH